MSFSKLHSFIESLPIDVKLVAVTKYHSVEEMQVLYEAGLRCFAESRSKELLQKQTAFSAMGKNDVEWHFIGHLQTNKAKDVIGRVSLIQSVDSLHLLRKLEELSSIVTPRPLEEGQGVKVLLEMKIAQEESKHGFTEAEIHEVMQKAHLYPHLRICGLMGMATQTDDKGLVLSEFQLLHAVYERYQSETFNTLSAGISEDYPLALQAGANMIRIGSLLFEH